jgi:long-subunit acyl-CoA synthetase (AMP-forming)
MGALGIGACVIPIYATVQCDEVEYILNNSKSKIVIVENAEQFEKIKAKAVTNWTGDPGRLKKIKCRFSAPVMMEDTISVQGTVADVQAGLIKVNFKVIKQTGVEVLQNVEAEVEA